MTREADNPMTGSDFDWMVSNHAVWGWKTPLKASVSGFLSFTSLPFSLPFSPFPQKRLILRLSMPRTLRHKWLLSTRSLRFVSVCTSSSLLLLLRRLQKTSKIQKPKLKKVRFYFIAYAKLFLAPTVISFVLLRLLIFPV